MRASNFDPHETFIILAKNGIACLCYDPLGQGERRQLLDENGRPLPATTQEHNVMGIGCTLLGTSLARTMIWDGMRAIDYLQSRDDIDGTRIGCAGVSGGGTLTSYLGVVDERITVSAPGCYLTGFRSLLETIGPQDIEQNIFGQVANGFDHADYVLLRAPRPTLIMAATRDFFPIEGTWRIFREGKRAFGRMGYPERLDIVESDTPHAYAREHWVAEARWFGHWYRGEEPEAPTANLTALPEHELNCTPEGQVLRLPGARTMFELNRQEESALAPARRELWMDQAAAVREVRRVAGIRAVADLPAPAVKKKGRILRDGYRIQKLVISPEPGISLPALLFEPDGAVPARSILYLHGGGKHVDAQPGGRIERHVRSGLRVLAVDLRGLGETARAGRDTLHTRVIGHDGKDWALAYLLGKSFVGMRAEDVLVCARYLAEQGIANGDAAALVALGDARVPALHAAALEPGLFSAVDIKEPLTSWVDFLREPLLPNQQINVVFGALRVYDLPDLVATLQRSTASLSPSDR